MKLSNRESLCLDLIRVVASQAVVIGHGVSFFGIFRFLHEPNFPWIQNIAVVVFFILSGFVITYSARLKSNNNDYGFFEFFSDRASRIFSAYIVALLFVFVVDSYSIFLNETKYLYKGAFNSPTFFANMLMLQDYPLDSMFGLKIFQFTSFGSARVFWTISIEWWMYMFFGVIFFMLVKNEKISIFKIFLFIISSVVISWYAYDSRGEHLTIYWFFGMAWLLFYDKYKKYAVGVTPNLIILLCSVSTCIAIQLKVINGYNFYFAIFLSMAIVSFINVGNYFAIEKIKSVINVFASYSFTLYLIHYSIMDFILRHVNIRSGYLLFIFVVLLSNLVAYIISRYSEFLFKRQVRKVFIKLRDIVFGKKISKA